MNQGLIVERHTYPNLIWGTGPRPRVPDFVFTVRSVVDVAGRHARLATDDEVAAASAVGSDIPDATWNLTTREAISDPHA